MQSIEGNMVGTGLRIDIVIRRWAIESTGTKGYESATRAIEMVRVVQAVQL